MVKRPALSILQLGTDVPSLAGDVGHGATYLKPVDIVTVPQATPVFDQRVFAQHLARARGEILTTTSSSLAPFQDDLQLAIPRPFVGSVLSALPVLTQQFAPQQMLILTADQSALLASGLDREVATARLPADGLLHALSRGQSRTLFKKHAETEVCATVQAALTPDTALILLENAACPPFTTAIRATFDLPVVSLLTCLEAMSPGLVDPVYKGNVSLLGAPFVRAMTPR